jgi:hypothetical protein
MDSALPLEVYLEKLASGDRELAPIICKKLAQQLVYVPVRAGGKAKVGTKLVFQVVKLPEGSVPVFTTEAQYRAWAQANPDVADVFTVLGGDLCATVGERATVILDLGSNHSSILDYALMQLVANGAAESVIGERDLRIGANTESPPLQVKPAETNSFSISETEAAASTLPELTPTVEAKAQPAEPEPVVPEGLRMNDLRGRSHPTSIMPRPPRPKVDFDRDVHRQSAIEGFKPVITTADPDATKLIRSKDDPKKAQRRSLLKFLGG